MKNLTQVLEDNYCGNISAARFVRIHFPLSSVIFYDPANDDPNDPSPYSNTTVLSLDNDPRNDITMEGDCRDTIWERQAGEMLREFIFGKD